MVIPDIVVDRADKIAHAAESIPANALALNIGEPEFGLIQPRRVDGREVVVAKPRRQP